MKKITNSLTFLLLSIVLFAFAYIENVNYEKRTNAQRLHDAIITYADSFNVPLNIAFNVAKLETGYLGPHHENYNHKQISKAGAVGAMQIMPKYASYFAGFKVNRQELKDSIELNVYVSMKALARHYERYGDWRKVLGAYHTGRPVVNWYAKKGTTMDYKDYWLPEPERIDSLTNDTMFFVNRSN